MSQTACIAMPSSVFARAVVLALDLPVEDFIASTGRANSMTAAWACEDHPAITVVCRWWNDAAPDPRTRCAGYFVPWVLAADGGTYQCALDYVPDIRADDLTATSAGNAHIGELLLVEHMKSTAHTSNTPSGWQTYHVTGYLGPSHDAEPSIGPDEVPHDEARETLWALAHFPENFPQAWVEIWRLAQCEWSGE
jgi:hypothetical protein